MDVNLEPFIDGNFIHAWMEVIKSRSPDMVEINPEAVKAIGMVLLGCLTKTIMLAPDPDIATPNVLLLGKRWRSGKSTVMKYMAPFVPVIMGSTEAIGEKIGDMRVCALYIDEIHMVFKMVKRRGYLAELPELIKQITSSMPILMYRRSRLFKVKEGKEEKVIKVDPSIVVDAGGYYVPIVAATNRYELLKEIDETTAPFMRRFLVVSVEGLPYSIPELKPAPKWAGELIGRVKGATENAMIIAVMTRQAKRYYSDEIAPRIQREVIDSWMQAAIADTTKKVAAMRAVDALINNIVEVLLQHDGNGISTECKQNVNLISIEYTNPKRRVDKRIPVWLVGESSSARTFNDVNDVNNDLRMALEAFDPLMESRSLLKVCCVPVSTMDIYYAYQFVRKAFSGCMDIVLGEDVSLVANIEKLCEVLEKLGGRAELKVVSQRLKMRYTQLFDLLRTAALMGRVKLFPPKGGDVMDGRTVIALAED